MKYRRLGKSGLQVSELSFGAWVTFAQQISEATAERLMTIAYDAGVNFFDNAEAYADGKAAFAVDMPPPSTPAWSSSLPEPPRGSAGTDTKV